MTTFDWLEVVFTIILTVLFIKLFSGNKKLPLIYYLIASILAALSAIIYYCIH